MSIVHILYFSATGNTRRALGIIADHLAGKGYDVVWHDLGEGPPLLGPGSRDDFLLVGFPALGFSAPAPVIKVLKSLPRFEGRRAALLCACGATWHRGKCMPGWAGSAVLEAERILKSKGLEILGSAELSYPENWRQVSRPASGKAKEALLAKGDCEARTYAAAISRALDGGEPSVISDRPIAGLLMPLVSRLFRFLGRRALVRLFVADGDCTGCGACVRACPTKAIRLRNGCPVWSMACSACNRCINVCPANAIQTSNLRLVLVGLANVALFCLSFPLSGFLVSSLVQSPGTALARLSMALLEVLAALSLYTAFTFFQVGPLDVVLRFLERRPALRRLFTRSATKSYARYLAPGFESEALGRGPQA